MPSPVCMPCAQTMRPVGPAVVQYNAKSQSGGPYEQWHADVYQCPGCKTTVASGFGGSPSWRHNQGREGQEQAAVIVRER